VVHSLWFYVVPSLLAQARMSPIRKAPSLVGSSVDHESTGLLQNRHRSECRGGQETAPPDAWPKRLRAVAAWGGAGQGRPAGLAARPASAACARFSPPSQPGMRFVAPELLDARVAAAAPAIV